MKPKFVKKIAPGIALLLPIAGVAFVGVQSVGVPGAGADTIGTVCFSSPSEISIQVPIGGFDAILATDLADGTSTGYSTGCIGWDFTTDENTVNFSVPAAGYGTVTIGAGDIVGTATDLVIGDFSSDISVTLTASGFSGCTINDIGAGQDLEFSASSNPLELSGAPVSIPDEGYSGSCTDSAALNYGLAAPPTVLNTASYPSTISPTFTS